MSHEIDETTGHAAVMVAGDPAWHKLGVNVREAQTAEQAIKLARLNWTVEQWAVEASSMKEVDGELKKVTIDVPDKYTLVRSDTEKPLATLSTSYVPFQNVEAFDFFNEIVDDDLAMYETAGALRGGRTVWIMASIPSELQALPGDITKPYVLLTNSHDGTRCLRMIPTSVRVVCQNTLNFAIRESKKSEGISITHRGKLSDKVDQAREALGLILERFETAGQEMKAMAETQLNREDLMEYIAGITLQNASTKTAAEKLASKINANLRHPTNRLDGMGGTVWAAYNAASFYADHQKTVIGENETAKADSRLNSMWFGSGNKLKMDAYKKALELVS